MPAAKSVQLVVGSRVRFNGIHGIKKKLLVGVISGIVGCILIYIIDASFRYSTLYLAFGVFGFVSYISLLRFANIEKPV